MVRAYILIEMAAGHSRDLVDSLKSLEEVRDVLRVTGPFDVIVVFEADTVDAISNRVADHVHSQSGVIRTTTCVAIA